MVYYKATVLLEVLLAELLVVVDRQLIPVQLQMSLTNKLMDHTGDRFARGARHVRHVLLKRQLVDLNLPLPEHADVVSEHQNDIRDAA